MKSDNQRLKDELRNQRRSERKIKWLSFKSQVRWLLSQLTFKFPWFDRVSYAINLLVIWWLYTHHTTILIEYLLFSLLMPNITLNTNAISKQPGPAHESDSQEPDDLAGYMKRIHNNARKHD